MLFSKHKISTIYVTQVIILNLTTFLMIIIKINLRVRNFLFKKLKTLNEFN